MYCYHISYAYYTVYIIHHAIVRDIMRCSMYWCNTCDDNTQYIYKKKVQPSKQATRHQAAQATLALQGLQAVDAWLVYIVYIASIHIVIIRATSYVH